MDNQRNTIKRAGTFLLILAIVLLAAVGVEYLRLPGQVEIYSDEMKVLNLPFKDVTITVLPETKVIPGGQSVGVTMDVKGVLIVGLEEIETTGGERINPGLLAGLQIGDSILSINGQTVDSAADVQAVVNDLTGTATLKVRRKDELETVEVEPVQSAEDNMYKIGVWVRNKTAGLGTLTFYIPDQNMTYGALGHGILDPATGDLLTVRSGELLNTRVESVKQGKAGSPGEIRGIFYEAEEPLGELKKNTDYGIFGSLDRIPDHPYHFEPISIGYQNEVEEGPAYILTTLEGNKMGKYDIMIEKVSHQSKPDTKSMVLKVTDPELLNRTGGIIQGMSGSPIIQNGKLIGAVTHVFVNDPERGYGIFIEWMLKQSDLAK